MPILSNFPSGGGGGTGGLTLAAVTSIQTLAAAGKVYVKWTDPDDLIVAGSTLAAWGGTLLVRKAGSAPLLAVVTVRLFWTVRLVMLIKTSISATPA